MQNHYVYYSYEPFGRGYIGRRSCNCPIEDDPYMGSYKDKSFNPTHKIIIKTFNTREEALEEEIKLHKLYDVDNNPIFANRAKQKSTKFSFSCKGCVRSDEYKKKMSESLKGRVIKPEWIEKAKQNRRSFVGESNPFYGKTHRDDTKNKISNTLKSTYNDGKHPWLGRKHSEESKEKFRKNNAGKNNPNYGKVTPDEVRNKIGQSKVGRKLWNNGKQQKFSKECPGDGWVLGGIKFSKEVT